MASLIPLKSAVTKSGTGTWDLVHEDSGLGTRGLGDSGTGDSGTPGRGTWDVGRGDAETRGRGDAGTRDSGEPGRGARGRRDVGRGTRNR